ncbi:MAG: hypothetical protein LCH43_09830 [Actinobacteria bacterium]|nr:hypothetical protein [Actinomycetota bacterium]
MNDLDLVTAFERGTLTSFPHREHVRVAWILLERDGYDRAVAAMTGGIRRMAIAAGLLSKYHETRTTAWMRLINDARTELFSSSSDFVDHRPALLRPDRLNDHYSAGRLASDEARTAFVEPDLTPLP